MSKFALCLLVLALSNPAIVGSTAAQNAPSHFVAVPELRPAAAIGDVPALARTSATPEGRRVLASVPAAGDARQLGPPAAGDDGAPAMVALPDGDFLVVAARWNARGARLWAQPGGVGGWRRARHVRRAGSSDHHPALAVGRRAVWMTWVSQDSTGSSFLVAAAWNGRAFSVPERLPSVGGAPGVPAIAVGADEQPAIVWSAYDGTDTEVWISRRTARGWSTPAPLTDNDTPDEFPDIGRGRGQRLVVSWSGYAPRGYQPFASYELADGSFAPVERLDTDAAGVTNVLGGADDTIAWATILPTTYELRLVARNSHGWQRAAHVGEIETARLRATLRDSRLLVTTSAAGHAEGTLRRSNATVHPGADFALPLLVAQVGPRGTLPSLPGTYRGFGDSITSGTTRTNGVVTETEGYPVPLATYIGAFLGRKGIVVENAGAGGEVSTDGLGRLAGLNATAPKLYTFIMEGANDASALVDPNTLAANLRGMVRDTLAAGGVAIISTVTPRGDGAFLGGLNPRIVRYNDLIVPMARSEGALLVDQWSAFYKKGRYYSDLLHPNVPGYAHMATTWFRGLQPLFAALLQSDDDEADATLDAARALARSDRGRPDPGQ